MNPGTPWGVLGQRSKGTSHGTAVEKLYLYHNNFGQGQGVGHPTFLLKNGADSGSRTKRRLNDVAGGGLAGGLAGRLDLGMSLDGILSPPSCHRVIVSS
jgi:hypothetical protein